MRNMPAKRSKKTSCNAISSVDLKGVEGLVDSRNFKRAFAKHREATPEERASFAALQEKAGHPLPAGKKVVYSEPGEEPFKVILLEYVGFPMIDVEWQIWPNDNMSELCDEVASFYLLGDGNYYTNKNVKRSDSPSKTAGKWRGSDYPRISGDAGMALHEGKTLLHTIGANGVSAVKNLKRLLGIREI
jgi:hypothetical protein